MPQEHQVLVKRKAHDEPLELLYLDDHGQREDSPRKRRQIFRRVQVPDTTDVSPPPVLQPLNNAQPKDALFKVKSSEIRARSRSPRPRLEPRRLHMLKERVSSGAFGAPPAAGQKRKAGSQLVVFEERAEEPPRKARPAVPTIELPASRSVELPASQPEEPSRERTRKRPNITAAERLWRQASWSNFQPRSRSASPFPGRGSEDHLGQSVESLKLAEELQHFALEESVRDERREAAKKTDDTTQKGAPSDESFVYDRYVRCNTPSATGEDGHDQEAVQLGYLVIAQEDEAAWTAYLDEFDHDEDDDDELARLEDEEDSNAEDYYTNDYPDEDFGSPSSFGSAGGARPAYGSDYDLNDPGLDVGFSDDEKWELTSRSDRVHASM